MVDFIEVPGYGGRTTPSTREKQMDSLLELARKGIAELVIPAALPPLKRHSMKTTSTNLCRI